MIKKSKSELKQAGKNAKSESIDFHLNPPYQAIDEYHLYSSEKRVAKIFGARNKNTGEEFVRLLSKSKKPKGWSTNWGVNLYNSLHINRLFATIVKIISKLKWVGVKDITSIDELKQQIRERENTILNLEEANEKARLEHDRLMTKLRKQQTKILQSRVDEFRVGIKELKNLIQQVDEEKVSESQLQEFLYNNPWFFGTEYINSTPQKFRGAHSKFDFYLERFNKTNDIVEIKLLSDSVINKNKSIGSKVIQAVDQLIEYMESSIAAAHSSVISKEEGILELRPRGIVVIGSDNSEASQLKLKKWNYQFAHITILTYVDILKKAKSMLKNIINKSQGRKI